MRKIALLALLLAAGSAWAQTPQEEYATWRQRAQGNYSRFRQQQIDEYQTFRKQANKEYAEFVKEAWARVRPEPPREIPNEPKPPIPSVAPKEAPTAPTPLPYKEASPAPDPKPVPEVPIPQPEVPVGRTTQINYYGTLQTIHVPSVEDMKLKSLDGESISDMWTKLSDGSCDALLTDCLQAKKDLMLNDWGYIMWLQHVSRGIIKDRNMTVLMEQWLLTQSGYRARMAMTGSGLLLIFMPFDVPVFETPYIILDEEPFFLVTSTKSENNELQVFDHAFPGENTASLRVAQLPKLANKPCERRTLASKAYPAMAIQTTVNKNLIDYCNHYPKVAGSWDIYANASLSEDVKRMIYPRLTKIIKGLDEKEQAEVLLNWIQTAFEYKTDEDQFGGERSLFADETLYYPYCDCEDRSILLSILIHDLMGLDVVLLHFPGHLATAVKFSTHVEGDYLDLEDGTYIVCDPTYINAPVGMAMPDCKEQEVTVFRILRRQ